MNADPTFVYEQQMARVFGLEVLHMADTDVLPYDYMTYASQIQAYLFGAQSGRQGSCEVDLTLDAGAARFAAASCYRNDTVGTGTATRRKETLLR